MILEEYLRGIEDKGKHRTKEDAILWPQTPIDSKDIQLRINARVGASDNELQEPQSRTYKILTCLTKLVEQKIVKQDFSLLDICCGDAAILCYIKKEFPESRCYGLDCNVGQFATHRIAEQAGVKLYNGYIQDLFHVKPPESFDFAMMLNTYMGWEWAELPDGQKDLPTLVDGWFWNNVKHAILTMTPKQICNISYYTDKLLYLGSGEAESSMILCDYGKRIKI